MRICDLREWRSCLESMRERLDYSGFKEAAVETEWKIIDYALALSDKMDQEIGEGMLHTVVALSPQEVSPQLEQFAAEIIGLGPDPEAETASGPVAAAYRELLKVLAVSQRGLPAVVETFKAYAEGRYDLRNELPHLLEEAWHRFRAEPREALRLVGEAGSLQIRGMGEVDELRFDRKARPLEEPLGDWVRAAAGVLWHLDQALEKRPLGEVELARDMWRAPEDKERLEYKKSTLVRLGIGEPEFQSLLLPLFGGGNQRLFGPERTALIAAGQKVVPGLIAIAADVDSQLGGSISEGEASIRAVQLLGDMRAPACVPTLIQILKDTDYLAIIHDRAIQVLHDQMPDLAFDMALEEFDSTGDVEFKCEMAGILAKGGRGKPGVFERLIELFRKQRDQRPTLATYLADLGDRRALPDLHDALRTGDEPFWFADIEEAIAELGGELTEAEKQNLQRRRKQLLSGHGQADALHAVFAPKAGPTRVTKIGRNEPCPCGSGKKHKKCCGR